MNNIALAFACFLLNVGLWLVEPALMLLSLPRWLDRRYRIQVLLAKDQIGNAYAAGWADESISARAWRLRHIRRWALMRRLVDALFFWQPDHCLNAYRDERDRLQIAPEYRT